jgi:hypothetical protein
MTSTSPAAVAVTVWLGTWARPPDRPAQTALAVGAALLAVALVPGGTGWLASTVDLASVADLGRRRRFLTVAAFAAAFLSLGYIAFYLRGGPRAPEAAAYWLQGRALSHGALSWTSPEPTANFRASNLLFRAPDRLSGIFPPAYPLLLAAGFLVGAPMLIGPLLAAALVVATWLLAHEVAANVFPPLQAEAMARLAVGLSIVSAALRCQTADALPYGAAAVAVASGLACALRARRTGNLRLFGAAGLALGFLVASHPASALALGMIVTVLAWGATPMRRRIRALAATCVAALPGLVLLLAANRAATGHPFTSAATEYFGAIGVGGPHTPASVRSTWQCAREHLQDIGNLEPLALLALVPLVGHGARSVAVLMTALVIGGDALALATMHADPVSSGDPARALVAVVPLEHVLVALGVARLFPRAFAAAGVTTLALAVGGFAIHASHAHEALATRDVGHPRFEPDVVREANVTHGLLFFDDDTGYELAHDPGLGASHGIEAARLRGDDHDRLLYDLLGHPPVHRYGADGASASVFAWTPPSPGGDTWRFEAENDWPPFAPTEGTVDVIDTPGACASDGRVLRLTPAAGREASVMVALPLPQTAAPATAELQVWRVAPRVFLRGEGGQGTLALLAEPGQPPLAEWSWGDPAGPPMCVDLPVRAVDLGGRLPAAWLVLRARGGAVLFDKTTLRAR